MFDCRTQWVGLLGFFITLTLFTGCTPATPPEWELRFETPEPVRENDRFEWDTQLFEAQSGDIYLGGYLGEPKEIEGATHDRLFLYQISAEGELINRHEYSLQNEQAGTVRTFSQEAADRTLIHVLLYSDITERLRWLTYDRLLDSWADRSFDSLQAVQLDRALMKTNGALLLPIERESDWELLELQQESATSLGSIAEDSRLQRLGDQNFLIEDTSTGVRLSRLDGEAWELELNGELIAELQSMDQGELLMAQTAQGENQSTLYQIDARLGTLLGQQTLNNGFVLKGAYDEDLIGIVKEPGAGDVLMRMPFQQEPLWEYRYLVRDGALKFDKLFGLNPEQVRGDLFFRFTHSYYEDSILSGVGLGDLDVEEQQVHYINLNTGNKEKGISFFLQYLVSEAGLEPSPVRVTGHPVEQYIAVGDKGVLTMSLLDDINDTEDETSNEPAKPGALLIMRQPKTRGG